MVDYTVKRVYNIGDKSEKRCCNVLDVRFAVRMKGSPVITRATDSRRRELGLPEISAEGRQELIRRMTLLVAARSPLGQGRGPERMAEEMLDRLLLASTEWLNCSEPGEVVAELLYPANGYQMQAMRLIQEFMLDELSTSMLPAPYRFAICAPREGRNHLTIRFLSRPSTRR